MVHRDYMNTRKSIGFLSIYISLFCWPIHDLLLALRHCIKGRMHVKRGSLVTLSTYS
jgi:hypothetical protein